MTPQQSIAHYRIISKLGEGGMGEVWRATDTKLNREIAIKVLPQAVAADPDRLVRFTREAQVLASLNHPNIAAIYGVEERALIMELVEGSTLAERIAQGPVPLEESILIAKQLAEALEYAHDRGVIHRDLKPANIKITPEGRVKVLDFGLAKALSNEPATLDPKSSPTITMRATLAGTIMGTAAYMSPEQARGQTVDRRADIWAFGVVLYEMLTGGQLFRGSTVSDTLTDVLRGDLDLSEIPAGIRPVMERCLQRDPRLRWRSIGDVFVMLEEGAPAAPATPVPRLRRRVTPWIVTGLALALGGAGWWRATRPVDHPLTRLSVDLGPEALPSVNLTAAISPDGRRLVYRARGPDGKPHLAMRLLDQALPTLLPGTENGSDPFFSPDSQSIGFFAGLQLKTMSVQGGSPVTLWSAQGTAPGGSWGSDGDIITATGSNLPLSRIPSAGGTARPLTKLGPHENSHRWPQVLPGGKAALFTASPSSSVLDRADIEAVWLKTGQTKIVQRGGYYGRYLPSGHLLYIHQGTLFAVRFDPEKLEVQGSPVPLLADVAANPVTAGGQFDFSRTGTFVYAAGKSAAENWRVSWLDSSGRMQPLMATPGAYTMPHLSPDGHKLAFVGSSADIYVYDLERDVTIRLTFTGESNWPVWAPDGRHIAFSSGSGLFWKRSDGSGDAQLLLENSNNVRAWSCSPSGRLAYFERGSETNFDIWTLPLDLTDPDHPKPGKPEAFLRTPAAESIPRFSPDGRWIAYRSIETNTSEIYVRPFPPAGEAKWQISTGGGLYPVWSNNGRELFYEAADNRIMVVDYTVEGGSFVPGKPRQWSEKQLFYTGTSNLDLAPDGKRFVVFSPVEPASGETGSVHVTVLFNFFDELKRKIP